MRIASEWATTKIYKKYLGVSEWATPKMDKEEIFMWVSEQLWKGTRKTFVWMVWGWLYYEINGSPLTLRTPSYHGLSQTIYHRLSRTIATFADYWRLPQTITKILFQEVFFTLFTCLHKTLIVGLFQKMKALIFRSWVHFVHMFTQQFDS